MTGENMHLLAIAASCGYLVLSGMPISGQRAVVSSSIVYVIILGKP